MGPFAKINLNQHTPERVKLDETTFDLTKRLESKNMAVNLLKQFEEETNKTSPKLFDNIKQSKLKNNFQFTNTTTGESWHIPTE